MGDLSKPWWASRTVLAGLVGALFAILSAVGVMPEGLTQDMVLEGVLGVVSVLAIIFRVKATSSVG